MSKRQEAKEFALAVVQMVQKSDMHKSLVWAELISAVADAMVDLQGDNDIATVRLFAQDIRRRALVD
jgi:hypothetical protein